MHLTYASAYISRMRSIHISTPFPFLLPHRTCSLSRACALKEWKNNLVVIFVKRKERLSLYYLYVISILLLYYIYIIVRSFFASDTPYLRIFTPILTHLIDFLTHQVRIFFTSRCQIHAPAFPSKTSFNILSRLRQRTYHSLRSKEYHAQQRCAYHVCVSIPYHVCVSIHITNA